MIAPVPNGPETTAPGDPTVSTPITWDEVEETLLTAARTPGELYAELSGRYPFSLAPEVLRVAINTEFRDWSTPLAEGDAVELTENDLKQIWSDTREPALSFAATVPYVRRLLANVATYMMCDDHEITDDWFLNRDITAGLVQLLERDGVKHVADAVGVDA